MAEGIGEGAEKSIIIALTARARFGAVSDQRNIALLNELIKLVMISRVNRTR